MKITTLKIVSNIPSDFLDRKFLEPGTEMSDWQEENIYIVDKYTESHQHPGIDGQDIKVLFLGEGPRPFSILKKEGMPDLYVVKTEEITP